MTTKETLPESVATAGAADADPVILTDPDDDVKGASIVPDDGQENVDIDAFLDSPALTVPEGDPPPPQDAARENVVQTAPADQSAQQAALSGVTLNKDGTPRKKRGRKPGSTNTPAQIAATTPQLDETIVGTAQFTVDAVTGALAMIIGPEWQAEKDERETLIAQTAHYFRSQNIADVPPGVLLALVCAGYAVKRVQNENTATKLKIFALKSWAFMKSVTGFGGK